MRHFRGESRELGGAVVETALLMMIFVPLIMYVMFIQDAMHHLLSIQEAAIASIWDFSTAPFGVNKKVSQKLSTTNGEGSVDKYNKWQFIDHESAYIHVENPELMRDDDATDSNGNGLRSHHNSPFVETTWVGGSSSKDSSYGQYYNKNGSQVVCQRQGDRSFSLASIVGGVGQYASKYAPYGGNYVCWAKGFILNKILPRTFMPEFIKTDVYSGQKYGSGNAHDHAASSNESQQEQAQNGGSDLFLYFRARAALLADSWAALGDHLNSGHKDYEIEFADDFWGPSQNQYFYERVNVYFDAGGGLLSAFNLLKTASIASYQLKLLSEHLAITLGVAQPTLLWLAATYSHSGKDYKAEDYRFKPSQNIFGKKHYTTSSEEYLKLAETDRTEYYLGFQREE